MNRALQVACAALIAFSACGKKKPEAKGDEKRANATIAADASLPPEPGLVYFAVNREGVVELRGGEFRRVLASQGRIDDLAVSVTGEVFVVADAQIVTPDEEGGAVVVGNRSAPGVARRIAAASDGALWAITGKGLWYRIGSEWKIDDTFPRPRTVVDIVATRGGRVVAAARDAAFVHEPDGWREIALPEPPPEPPAPPAPPSNGSADDDTLGDGSGVLTEDGKDEEGSSAKKQTFVRSLALGADDRVYASTSSGVYLLGDATWERVADKTVGALAVAGDGTLVAAAESGGLLFGRADGLAEREIAALGIAASELDAIATDSLSRMWLATDGGLVIANDQGDPIAAYSAGSQPALSGRIAAIHVVTAPTFLPEITERRIGAVVGTLIGTDKATVAGAEVELCARPDTLFRGSPCAESSLGGKAVTDKNGAFRVEGIPAGRYGLAIKSGGEWTVDLTIDCCAQLFTDGEVKLPKISVAP